MTNNLRGSSQLDVARQRSVGAANISSYGEITTSGAVTDHLIWPLAGSPNIPIPGEAGVQLTLSSSSANDAAAGTGIRTIAVVYLDGDLVQQTEIVTLNGTSGVTTVATDVRFVQCMHLVTAGSGKKAAGNISAVHSGTTYSYIPTGERRCSSSARRVPAGKRLIIHGFYWSAISGSGQARASIRLVYTGIYNTDLTEDGITMPQASVGTQDGSGSISGLSVMVPSGVVVGMEVTCDKAATISAGFVGWWENA